MPADDRLEDLLLVWGELKEQGQRASAEELCRDCPELADEYSASSLDPPQVAARGVDVDETQVSYSSEVFSSHCDTRQARSG